MLAFAETRPVAIPRIALIDFDNDCVGTALAVARVLGPQLWGVRLDTSSTMVDRSLSPQMGRFDPRGVNPQLVRNVREAYGLPCVVSINNFPTDTDAEVALR